MLVYILLFWFVYFFAFFDVIKSDKNIKKNHMFLLVVVLLTLFAGLRFNIGADYLGYYGYFNKAEISLFGELEVGFEVLIVLVRTLFGSYEVFVLILVTLIFLFIYMSIKNMSKIYLIPIYIYMIQYFLGGPMGQMRQALAIAVLLYSIKFVLNKNLPKFLFFVALAASFHITSFIFLIAYISNYIKLNKGFTIITVIVSMILGKTSLPSDILIHIYSIFNLDIFNSLMLYVESEYYGAEYSGSLFAYVERLLIFIISLLLYKDSDDKKIKVFIQIYWFSLIIFFMFSDIAILAQRLSRPFKTVEIFMYGYLIEKFTFNKYLRIIGFLALALLMYKPVYMILSRPNQYIPYMSIFGG